MADDKDDLIKELRAKVQELSKDVKDMKNRLDQISQIVISSEISDDLSDLLEPMDTEDVPEDNEESEDEPQEEQEEHHHQETVDVLSNMLKSALSFTLTIYLVWRDDDLLESKHKVSMQAKISEDELNNHAILGYAAINKCFPLEVKNNSARVQLNMDNDIQRGVFLDLVKDTYMLYVDFLNWKKLTYNINRPDKEVIRDYVVNFMATLRLEEDNKKKYRVNVDEYNN